jgi:hypothetical protein
MGRLARWCGAVAVTIMAFAAATWVAGALVLPSVMHSSDIRWLVAAGLGVAVAALAALGGHSFATRDTSATPAGRTVTASGTGSIAVGGEISGTASTGGRSASSRRPPGDDAGTRPTVDPGTVTASGNNSIAAGGDISGDASTGTDIDGLDHE